MFARFSARAFPLSCFNYSKSFSEKEPSYDVNSVMQSSSIPFSAKSAMAIALRQMVRRLRR